MPLCGNSIATDRWFIARDMPELDSYLHYRMIDVSSVKEGKPGAGTRRAYFASFGQARRAPRARADITESVQEAQVLPGGGVRPGTRPGLADRPGDRHALREQGPR